MFTLLDSVLDSDIKGGICDLQKKKNRASFKDGVCQILVFCILRNTLFRSFYHRILSASYRRRVYLMYSGDLFDPLLTLAILLRRDQSRT